MEMGVFNIEDPSIGNPNELTFGTDMMVMANPYMAGLPSWVIALLMAGCIAAALSTAAGLLLVLSTSIAHDLVKKIIQPTITDRQEVGWARAASFSALLVAVWFGINPPSAFIAKTVAFAFGLAASSFFPTLLLGIFSRRVNRGGRHRWDAFWYLFYARLHYLFSVSRR